MISKEKQKENDLNKSVPSKFQKVKNRLLFTGDK
jgi:hypothetical protein